MEEDTTISNQHSEPSDFEHVDRGADSPAEASNLPRSCTVLTCNNPENPFGGEQTFYIVGTAHVSADSCLDVRRVIRHVKPEVVFLELCPDRRGILTMTKQEVQSSQELIRLWRTGQAPLMFVAYSWMLGQVGDALGVQPGEEFRVALLEAQQVGAKVMLGDRPVRVTLARTWAALSTWSKLKFIWALIWTGFSVPDDLKAEVEAMKDADVLTQAMKEMAAEFPQLVRPLIHERDEYMAFMLRALASKASKVVAVVGAGHLQGIRDSWNADIDIEEISSMPETTPKKSSSIVTWRRVALIGVSGAALTAFVVMRWRR